MTMKIKTLTRLDYLHKLKSVKKKYLEHPYPNMRFVQHIKKVYDTNKIYCNVCEKSLEDCIGKEIVYNTGQHRTYYYHVDCARLKNII